MCYIIYPLFEVTISIRILKTLRNPISFFNPASHKRLLTTHRTYILKRSFWSTFLVFQKINTTLSIFYRGGEFPKHPFYTWSMTLKDDYKYIRVHKAGWISKAAAYLRGLITVKVSSWFMVLSKTLSFPICTYMVLFLSQLILP